ncbi:MAG: response regulator, partial [Actinomycetes bacterium]
MDDDVPGADAARNAGRGWVLVVDDDAALAEMLSIVLRSEGYEPIWVADGDEAVAAFHDHKPDLVLLDLMLPG